MAAEPTAPINYLNCRTGWLIAAMASVAWTHSQLISERARRENIVGAVDPGDADLFFELTDVLTIPVLFFTITIPFVGPATAPRM